jgi:lipopolysaccharide export system protein LptA
MSVTTQKLKAETDVRSIMDRKPDAGRGAPGQATQDAKEQTKLPSMLKQDQPVTIRSNRLEYDSAASHAIYSGSARLTQPGGTELQADTIDLDDKSGNLIAHLKVRTKMPIDDVDPKTNQRTSTETIGTSEHFVYDDAKRLATYTSAAPNLAHLVGAQGTVTTIETIRTAKGRHLTYTASDDTYVMVGSPVEVVQKETTSCKRTLAGVWRFPRAIDNITTEGSPQTTTNIPCPGTRD